MFLLGFLAKMHVGRGVFVVKMWWNAWQRWIVEVRFSASEIRHDFGIYFLRCGMSADVSHKGS